VSTTWLGCFSAEIVACSMDRPSCVSLGWFPGFWRNARCPFSQLKQKQLAGPLCGETTLYGRDRLGLFSLHQ